MSLVLSSATRHYAWHLNQVSIDKHRNDLPFAVRGFCEYMVTDLCVIKELDETLANLEYERIFHEVTNHSSFFRDNIDCIGKEGISPLMKCTSAIRQLAYGIVPDFLDEYLQISTKSSRLSLDHFCTSVMEIFGPEYLRKPTMTDVLKLYRHHEEKHGFSGMLGSLDCTDWEWFGCPYGFKAQYVRRDHGSNPFILLEAVAS
ncbi:reverse transcriptase domain-containing protein [Tanacetum coccineum]|uniref:Reverse transcriptase domain-containing protein n=1 Tax=Tanacetum coccineum TaxID=301880 RepID=A0ABQ4YCD1_9ASTR